MIAFVLKIQRPPRKDERVIHKVVSRSGMAKAKYSGNMFSLSSTELPSVNDLVEGKQAWEVPEGKKHDIEVMKRCCDAELASMDKAGLVPAPYYFERVAILSRKEKNYKQEVLYCEQYIEKIDAFYSKNGTEGFADVRKGPRYQSIVKRLPKAKELYAKNST